MANPMGHRARCTVCGAEGIVTSPGEGKLECCSRRMEDAAAQRSPRSAQPSPASEPIRPER
jgi:hypothetical protein